MDKTQKDKSILGANFWKSYMAIHLSSKQAELGYKTSKVCTFEAKKN